MTDRDLGVGCRSIVVRDAAQSSSIPVSLLYPARGEETPEPFGPFTLPLVKDARLAGGALPLVVSHGTGSTPWLHRGLGAHLARSGFVVALVQHPGNNRGDDALAGTIANLENRPRHVRMVIDAAFADDVVGAHLSGRGVGVVGHSLGGYTALAIAGGKPRSCGQEAPPGVPRLLAVGRDARVRALVLLAPATGWLMGAGALADVDVPILMRTGDRDPHTGPIHGEIVARGIPDPARLDHRVITGAGHFAFVSAYPPAMRSPAIPPSQDPEGFDRAAFLPEMFGEIEAFFRRTL